MINGKRKREQRLQGKGGPGYGEEGDAIGLLRNTIFIEKKLGGLSNAYLY